MKIDDVPQYIQDSRRTIKKLLVVEAANDGENTVSTLYVLGEFARAIDIIERQQRETAPKRDAKMKAVIDAAERCRDRVYGIDGDVPYYRLKRETLDALLSALDAL